jgi:predicted nuclease with TOPRIM domain
LLEKKDREIDELKKKDEEGRSETERLREQLARLYEENSALKNRVAELEGNETVAAETKTDEGQEECKPEATTAPEKTNEVAKVTEKPPTVNEKVGSRRISKFYI